MADPQCTQCGGLGERVRTRTRWLRIAPGNFDKVITERRNICGCVYRRVFRVCMQRYLEARLFGPLMIGASAGYRMGVNPTSRSLRCAEYVADIEMTARATLLPHPLECAIFRYHTIDGLPWRDSLPVVSRAVGSAIDKGTFYHGLYRMEARLGRVFLELEPYSLYPREYFVSRPKA